MRRRSSFTQVNYNYRLSPQLISPFFEGMGKLQHEKCVRSGMSDFHLKCKISRGHPVARLYGPTQRSTADRCSLKQLDLLSSSVNSRKKFRERTLRFLGSNMPKPKLWLSDDDLDFIVANTEYSDKEQLREQGGARRSNQ